MNDHFLYWYEVFAIYMLLGSITYIACCAIFMVFLHSITTYKSRIVIIVIFQLLISIVFACVIGTYMQGIFHDAVCYFPISIPALIAECIIILPILIYVYNKKRLKAITIKERILIMSIICSSAIALILEIVDIMYYILDVFSIIILVESILLIFTTMHKKL